MPSPLSSDEAITLLRKFVKYSEVKNQKHIDLSLCTAPLRPLAQKALMTVKLAVENNEFSEETLKERLGLE